MTKDTLAKANTLLKCIKAYEDDLDQLNSTISHVEIFTGDCMDKNSRVFSLSNEVLIQGFIVKIRTDIIKHLNNLEIELEQL